MVRKRKKRAWPFFLLFLLGLAILGYPLVSDWFYRIKSNVQIQEFQDEQSKLSEEEIIRRIELARIYNATLVNTITKDPYSKEQTEQAIKNYAQMLELKEKIGHIQIPSIDVDLPVYTGTQEEVLQKGAGHLEGTSLPIGGVNTHAVITAHSGLPQARLFTDLEKVEIGQRFYYHNIQGVLAYEVDQVKRVLPDNFSDLLVEPGKDEMTLMTCTPVMINTHRLLVRGHRVDYIPEADQSTIVNLREQFRYRKYFFIILGLFGLVLFAYLFQWRKNRKLRKRLEMLLHDSKSVPTGNVAEATKREDTDDKK